MEFFQSGRGDVDHVAGLEEVVVDVALERLRNLQVLVLIDRAEVGAAEVVVTAHEQDLQFGIALHGHGEVGHDVDAGVVPTLAHAGRYVLEIPVEAAGFARAGLVGQVLAVLEVARAYWLMAVL